MNQLEAETVIAVTSAIIELDYNLHGSEPYCPQIEIMELIIDFSRKLDACWDALPQPLQDSNDKVWCYETVPHMVANCWTPDGGWELHQLTRALVEYMTGDWKKEELREYVVNHALFADAGI